jgi:hypothetical protein
MSAPAKFRKKPVVIEAIPLTETNGGEIVRWITEHGRKAVLRGGDGGGSRGGTVHIQTLEGVHRADLGDYVIKGVAGEFYPCKPDIFWATYEAVAK